MKILRWVLGLVGLVILVMTVSFFILDEPLPEGTKGPEAEALADKILTSLNKQAYDSISFISWSYRIGHYFEWDKKNDRVLVKWEDIEVELDIQTQSGEVRKSGDVIESPELSRKAYEYFINDSFWLVAPYKLKDPGTIRKVVNTSEGDALLVTYTTGGVTPGDSYLWTVDENFRPTAWKFWVNIIPVGGLEFEWKHWVEYEGAWFATRREGPFTFDIEIYEVR